MTSPNNLLPIALEIQNLTVDYGTQLGVQDISIQFRLGEIHAIVGDHGAGKSTIVKVLAGSIHPKQGRIFLKGNPLDTRSTDRVLKQGLLTVYQDIQIIPALSAYENVYLNREWKKNFLQKDHKKMRAHLLDVLNSLGLDIDIDKPMIYYRSNQQQLVEVARVLCFPADVVVIDELSTKLAPVEMERIHHFIDQLRVKGVTIIYISHNMREVVEFASTVTILKRGQVVETKSIKNTSEIELIQLTYSSMYPREDIENKNIELFHEKQLHAGVLRYLPIPLIVLDTGFRIVLINDYAKKMLEKFWNKQSNGLMDKSSPVVELQNNAKYKSQIWIHTLLWEALPLNEIGKEKCKKMLDDDSTSLLNLADDGLMESSQILSIHRLDASDTSLGFVVIFHTNKDQPISWTQFPLTLRTLAHEVNNPLSITLNHLELARRNNSLDGMLSHINAVEKEILRVTKLVQKALNTGDSDYLESEHSCSMGHILDELYTFLADQLSELKVELNIQDCKDILLPISTEEAKTVFLNLILNSLDAFGNNEGAIDIAWRIQEGETIVSFSDNGPGVDPHIIPKLFLPFITTKSGNDGIPSGIGLSLCRRIMEEAGGSIRYIEKHGKGAIFEVRFPSA